MEQSTSDNDYEENQDSQKIIAELQQKEIEEIPDFSGELMRISLKNHKEEQEKKKNEKEKLGTMNSHSFDIFQILDMTPVNDQFQQQITQLIKLNRETISSLEESMILYMENDSLTKSLQQYHFIIKIFSTQLNMLIQLLQTKGNNEKIKEIQETYKRLQVFKLKIRDFDEINLQYLVELFGFIGVEILLQLKSNLQALENEKNKKKKKLFIILSNNIQISFSKFQTVVEVFPSAVLFDKADLLAQNQEKSEEWIQIKKHIEYGDLGPIEQIKQSFQKIVVSILSANASVAKSHEQTSSVKRQIVKAFGPLYYALNSQRAFQRTQIMISDPDIKQAKGVWDMMDEGLAKHGVQMIFPSITYCQQIFIENVITPIDDEYIVSELKNGTLNRIDDPQICPMAQLNFTNEETFTKNLFQNDEKKIQIRVLCNENLFKPNYDQDEFEEIQYFKEKPGFFDSIQGVFSQQKQKIHTAIIIHIHGGGFVSMSSRSHQTYSRLWANNLGIPIFSIDYKKAPENPYPEGLNDCWQAYNWIINFAPKFFNIIPKRIVLVGDSAGGNLVATLCMMCIQRNVRIPDGVVMAYPGMLCALDDLILPHTFLKLCLESYIQKEKGFNPDNDPFLSPVKASDQDLKILFCYFTVTLKNITQILLKLPPIRIVTGNQDPLHDECWRFIHKLMYRKIKMSQNQPKANFKSNLKKDIRMRIYEGMPHGFLNYDVPSGMPQAKICVLDTQEFLKQIILGK